MLLDTYAKVILSDWQNLAKLIASYGTKISEASSFNSSDEIHLLTDEQINNALEGPMQAFLKSMIHAHTYISRIRLDMKYTTEEAFKDENNVPDNMLSSKELKKIKDTDLTTIANQLTDLCRVQHEQWQELLSSRANQLLQTLAQQGISFSDIELKEYSDTETMDDLERRLIDLSIDPPKLKKGNLKLAQYFALKCDILLHSALSRQHQDNVAASIKQTMKPLQSLFSEITEQEKNLIAQQQQEIEQVMQRLNFAFA